jgi:hypothetical protein
LTLSTGLVVVSAQQRITRVLCRRDSGACHNNEDAQPNQFKAICGHRRTPVSRPKVSTLNASSDCLEITAAHCVHAPGQSGAQKTLPNLLSLFLRRFLLHWRSISQQQCRERLPVRSTRRLTAERTSLVTVYLVRSLLESKSPRRQRQQRSGSKIRESCAFVSPLIIRTRRCNFAKLLVEFALAGLLWAGVKADGGSSHGS